MHVLSSPVAHLLLLLLLSTLTILGFFLSSRGKEEQKPDGTVVRTGNIFKAWYFYWMQETGKKNYWYDYEHALQFIFHVRPYLSGLTHVDGSAFDLKLGSEIDERYYRNEDGSLPMGQPIISSGTIRARIPYIEKEMKVTIYTEKFRRESDTNWYCYIFVAKTEPVYRFPWWVRKMLVSCPTCHASVWGTLIFLAVHLTAWNYVGAAIYGWFNCSLLISIPLVWMAHTLALAFTLTLFYKKVS